MPIRRSTLEQDRLRHRGLPRGVGLLSIAGTIGYVYNYGATQHRRQFRERARCRPLGSQSQMASGIHLWPGRVAGRIRTTRARLPPVGIKRTNWRIG